LVFSILKGLFCGRQGSIYWKYPPLRSEKHQPTSFGGKYEKRKRRRGRGGNVKEKRGKKKK
jgi:hypothetical protein